MKAAAVGTRRLLLLMLALPLGALTLVVWLVLRALQIGPWESVPMPAVFGNILALCAAAFITALVLAPDEPRD